MPILELKKLRDGKIKKIKKCVHSCHGRKCQDSKLGQPEGQQRISMVIKGVDKRREWSGK